MFTAEIANDSIGFFGWAGSIDSCNQVGDEIITARYPKKKSAIDKLHWMANKLGWPVDWRNHMEDKTL